MTGNSHLILFFLCLASCAGVQNSVVKTSKHLRVIQFEPSVTNDGESSYQFEDQNYYYAFHFLAEDQKEASPVLEKITTNPEQEIEIKYYQGEGKACLKSIKVDAEVFEKIEVTRRCDLYVSGEKPENKYNHLRLPKRYITASQIKRFLRNNPRIKKYESLMKIQALSHGMPLKLLYFMWGKPEKKITDEDGVTLFTYSDWYVSVKNNKVFSFSSRDPVISPD